LKWGGKMTAAAKTGPAKHPRPASSHPASMAVSSKKGDNIGDPLNFCTLKVYCVGRLYKHRCAILAKF